jgi:hypothetical protein
MDPPPYRTRHGWRGPHPGCFTSYRLPQRASRLLESGSCSDSEASTPDRTNTRNATPLPPSSSSRSGLDGVRSGLWRTSRLGAATILGTIATTFHRCFLCVRFLFSRYLCPFAVPFLRSFAAICLLSSPVSSCDPPFICVNLRPSAVPS